MQYIRYRSSTSVVAVLVGALVVVAVFRISLAAGSEVGSTPQQDIIRLEHRLTQLEQRLFTMENNLRFIEQQWRMGGGGARSVSPDDFARLRLEVNAFEQRLAEHECGLAKLDERTLSPAMREARRKAMGNDLCRQNIDTPLQFSGVRR